MLIVDTTWPRLSAVQGLLRFDLRRPLDYDTSLAGLAPCQFVRAVCLSANMADPYCVRTIVNDIWAPLQTARRVAEELGVLDELAGLLEWETRRAFTVEDKEEGGLVHK